MFTLMACQRTASEQAGDTHTQVDMTSRWTFPERWATIHKISEGY